MSHADSLLNISLGVIRDNITGNTYQLHTKDWSDIKVVKRSSSFKLGSCYFLTVEEGYKAGSLNKITGKFELLESGQTYRLNVNKYEKPITTKLDSHNVQCGHVRFITPREDMMIGSYNKNSGNFVEFTEPIAIHQKDYHDPVEIGSDCERVW